MAYKSILALAAITLPLASLPAQAMPASEFLAKADALEKKGAMALFSGDLGRLKKEIQRSMTSLRAERLADRRAGRKPAYCPPEGAKGSLDTKEILNHFRSIPAAERNRMQVKDAMRLFMARKFPCPSLTVSKAA